MLFKNWNAFQELTAADFFPAHVRHSRSMDDGVQRTVHGEPTRRGPAAPDWSADQPLHFPEAGADAHGYLQRDSLASLDLLYIYISAIGYIILLNL